METQTVSSPRLSLSLDFLKTLNTWTLNFAHSPIISLDVTLAWMAGKGRVEKWLNVNDNKEQEY